MLMSKIYLSSFLRVNSYYSEYWCKQVKRIWAFVSSIYGQLTGIHSSKNYWTVFKLKNLLSIWIASHFWGIISPLCVSTVAVVRYATVDQAHSNTFLCPFELQSHISSQTFLLVEPYLAPFMTGIWCGLWLISNQVCLMFTNPIM